MDVRDRFLAYLEPVREPLTSYVRGLVWNPSDLGDALQSTMFVAFSKVREFREGTDFKAWIFRIATLTVFGINRNHETPVASAEIAAEAELEREYAYDELLQDPDRLLQNFDQEVRRAVLELPGPERAALLLVSVAGFKCREAAEALEMPIGSVMGYLARARGRLRERLADHARGRVS